MNLSIFHKVFKGVAMQQACATININKTFVLDHNNVISLNHRQYADGHKILLPLFAWET